MIDTHSHLSKRLNTTFELPTISKVILAGSNLEDSQENILLARQYPKKILAAVGIHPQENDKDFELLDKLLMENPSIVAVGECGLDFSESYILRDQEIKFRAQISLADKYHKPLIIHARKAVDESIAILHDYKKVVGGVFHCFAGGKKRVPAVLALNENWFIGIDGNITYEIGLEEVVKSVPQDRLILETDSPFLTPVPHRGEQNKPDFVEFIYRKVGTIWGKSFEETEMIVDGNAKRLFQII